jgi:hypothetical protein
MRSQYRLRKQVGPAINPKVKGMIHPLTRTVLTSSRLR